MVRFLTRPGCHLCEQALPLVRREAARAGYEVEVVDVESDDELLAEFGLRIPVLLSAESVVLAEGEIDRLSLRRAFRRTGARRWPRGPSPR